MTSEPLDEPPDEPPDDSGDEPPPSGLTEVPPPGPVVELAESCVRFVQAATGVTLDFSPETLPVLDHYIGSRRDDLLQRPETIGLVARAAGTYFGEVVRRQIRSFWNATSDDPAVWELRLEPVYLAFHPVAVAYDAITYGDEEGPTAHIHLDDEDRQAVEARLADLPSASNEEFFSFSTRLEVLEIAVEAIKSRMMSTGLGEIQFTNTDYEET